MSDTRSDARVRLIVNADDFGESSEVNEGIIRAHEGGIVTSASLLVNLSGFEDARARIRAHPRLDIGIHLNVYRGRPVSSATYLVNRHGMFLDNLFLFVLKCYLDKKRARTEITREFETQIRKATDAGIRISHLDTDKHLHTLPFIFKIVHDCAEEHGIPFIRFPYERLSFAALFNPVQCVKIIVANLCKPHALRVLSHSTCKSADYFYGISMSGRFSVRRMKKQIDVLKSGLNEFACHPGLISHAGTHYIDAHREQELRVLTDASLKEHILRKSIVLASFSDV